MPTRRCEIALLLIAWLLAACSGSETVTPTPPEAQTVTEITWERIVSPPQSKTKSFNQCDVASTLNVEVEIGQVTQNASTDETLFGGSLVVEGSLSPAVKVAVEGEFRKRFSEYTSNQNSHSERVELTIPPHVNEVHTFVWSDIMQRGTITYLENGLTQTKPYTWTTGTELIDTKGSTLPCPTLEAQGVVDSTGDTSVGMQANAPTSSPTPLPPTDTPVPEPTATATATWTPTATFTPTPKPAPTDTPTPVPDTPPGTVLPMGETWRQDGLTMRVYDFRFEEGSCSNGVTAADYWGVWKVRFTNTTDQDLVVNLTTDAWFLRDSTGHTYEMFDSRSGYGFVMVDDTFNGCWPYEHWNRGMPAIETLKAGESLTGLLAKLIANNWWVG